MATVHTELMGWSLSQHTYKSKLTERQGEHTYTCQKHRRKSAVETPRRPEATDCPVVPDICAVRSTQEQAMASVRQTSMLMPQR